MGWAYCGKDDYGREIGYGIAATCDKRGCDEVINRGLSYVCGTDDGEREMHGAEAGGCGRYFCGEHLGHRGPKGGCPHRFKGAYGVTFCQPMKIDETGEIYCACGYKHHVEWPEAYDTAVA